MIETKASALSKIKIALKDNQFWHRKLQSVDDSVQLHLGIFSEPYFTFILEGSKNIESRFSKKRIAPYEKVFSGDILLLKKTGGEVEGICIVDKVIKFKIVDGTLDKIKESFGSGIHPAGSHFWDSKQDSLYCTLMFISHICELGTVHISKSDRRGWVILK